MHSTDGLLSVQVPATILVPDMQPEKVPPILEFTQVEQKSNSKAGMLEHLASMYSDLGSVPVPRGRKFYPGQWLSPVITALGRLTQKPHHEFVASLGLHSEIRGSLG